MNLFSKVTDLPPVIYWVTFLVLMLISAGSFFIGDMLDKSLTLYAAAVSVLSGLFAVIALILRFHVAFEWFIDIVIVMVAVSHVLLMFFPDLSPYVTAIPLMWFMLFWVSLGGWILFYPYLAYRIWRRVKARSVPKTTPLAS